MRDYSLYHLTLYLWIPLIILLIPVSLGCFLCFHLYKAGNKTSTILSTSFGLTIAVLTTLLVPLDIFCLSNLKNLKDSLPVESREEFLVDVQNGTRLTYYVFYALDILFIAIMIPVSFYKYEERIISISRPRFTQSVINSLSYIIILAEILLFIVVSIAYDGMDYSRKSINVTEWANKFGYLGDYYRPMEDRLMFVVELASNIGIFLLTYYAGLALPYGFIDLIKGGSKSNNESLLRNSYSKYGTIEGGNKQPVSHAEAYQNQPLLHNSSPNINYKIKKDNNKCSKCLRLCEIIFGLFGFFALFTFIIFLIVSHIDRYFNGLGFKSGYLLLNPHMFYPIDAFISILHCVFPLDMFFYGALVVFIIGCSISSLKSRLTSLSFWQKDGIQVEETTSHGLYCLSFVVVFISIALNSILRQIMPYYTTFGNQQYSNQIVNNQTTPVSIDSVNFCSLNNVSSDNCMITNFAFLWSRVALKLSLMEFFSYWMIWLFIIVMNLGFILGFVTRRDRRIY